MLRSIFRDYQNKVKFVFDLKNVRKLQQKTELRREKNELKPYHEFPIFYRYFDKFVSDNGFLKNVPSELMFYYKQKVSDFEEVHEMVTTGCDDGEFMAAATAELTLLINQLLELQDKILNASTVDDRDVNECTFEVRAGVGGKEASLFVEELFDLYSKFIAYNNWTIRLEKDEDQVVIEDNSSLLTNSIEVVGDGCYQMLRHEAGVHRVQRVPKTERYGRIHTSTVSVSVIPVRNNLVAVKESDLKFEVKNTSGPGGQNVNRNLTCVRVTHLPSGHSVESSETRYQYVNKEAAIRKIKALLNQLEYDRLEREARTQKRLQIGIGARSDKIRTYNFPQDRVTDHRLASEGHLHNITGYMAGQQCDKMSQLAQRLETIRQQELITQLRTALEDKFSKHAKL